MAPSGLLARLCHTFLLSFLFTRSKAISVSTGPIFTIFLTNGRDLREFSCSGPVFPMRRVTLPWQPILWQNYLPHLLHLSRWHSETEWDNAVSIMTK